LVQFRPLDSTIEVSKAALRKIETRGILADSSLSRELAKAVESIPSDPQLFYQDFGYLEHPKTGQPSPKLAAYQYELWKAGYYHKYRLIIKGNKIGLTTSCLMELFYHAITDCAGHEILIIAQNLNMSKNHLYTLRKLVGNSIKYKRFIIGEPSEGLLRDEVTKITQLFLHNPKNPSQPTRIIAIPANSGNAVSWRDVKYVFISDITQSNIDYSEILSGAFTRLANSEGYFLLESIPGDPIGPVYDLWLNSRQQQDNQNQFWIREYPTTMAVDFGIVTQEFLDAERLRHGSLYSKFYDAQFVASGGNVFRLQDIQACEFLGLEYNPDDTLFTEVLYPKALSIDPGFGSSKFAILLTQLRNRKIEVLLADEFEQPSITEMIREIFSIIARYNVTKTFVDANNPEICRELKRSLNDNYYEIITKPEQALNSTQKVLPVNFGLMQTIMLTKLQLLVSQHQIAINNRFNALLVQMRIAQEVNGKLQKYQQGRTLDLIDALRMNILNYYHG
jgi:hypothetical protein